MKNIPEVRIAGYDDAWEQRKLSSVSDVRDGTHASPKYIREGYPLVTSKNVNNGSVNYDDVQFISEKDYLEINQRSKVDIHDILMGMIGTIGNMALVSATPDYAIKNVALIKYTGGIDYKYLYFALSSGSILAQLNNSMDGGTQKFIALGKIRDLNIPFPVKNEQIKIGEMFYALDNLLTLHQRKYEKLKATKAALLQKMFPKEGETVPELRFEGFTDAWEQRKVTDMFKVTRGYVLATTLTSEAQTEEMNYPVYSSQTKDKGLMGYYKDYLYEDAITWTTDGANAGTVNYRKGKFYCTNVCGVLLSDKVKANQMIAEALNNVAKGFVSYVGNPKLMNNVMSKIVIQIPKLDEERESISQLFASLDNLLTLHQRECEKLQDVKKALLAKMFPGGEN